MNRDHSTGLPRASPASADSTLTHLPKTPSAQPRDRLVLASTHRPAVLLSVSPDKPIKALSSSGMEHATWVTKGITAKLSGRCLSPLGIIIGKVGMRVSAQSWSIMRAGSLSDRTCHHVQPRTVADLGDKLATTGGNQFMAVSG